MSSAKFLEEFPPVSTAQWMDVIQKDLKGADFTKKLVWQTDEQIAVKPFYRSEDLAGLTHLESLPGEFPYTRGTRAANAWGIRERIEAATIAEARTLAQAALAAGAQELEFAVGTRGLTLANASDLTELVADLKCPVHFEAGAGAAALLKLLAEALKGRTEFSGSLDYAASADPAAAELVKASLKALPKFRPVTVRGSRLHNQGANVVQELGYAIAHGIEWLTVLTEAGLSVDEAASALTFSFAAGAAFFFEIAKLRAARMLWAKAVEAFGPKKPESAQARITVRTSRWDETIYDPHVNVLRATTQAMSAAMGGCDSLTVLPFDETYRHSDEPSWRLARNTQLVLKHEALLDKAVDPAGGSYYVEVLTDSIARESWKLMQEVEAAGGYTKTAATVTAAIEKSRAAKIAAVASRRQTILGTNQYPNRGEKMLDKLALKPEEQITPRASEVFEAIRLRTERHAAKGGKVPVFLLAEMGDLKMRKARVGFVSNFFGCAGFDIQVKFAADPDATVALAKEKKADVVVLCSSDEEYSTLAGPLCTKLNEAGLKVPVIVAGYPKDAIPALTAAGVADFVHIRTNAAESLSAWQAKLGVKE